VRSRRSAPPRDVSSSQVPQSDSENGIMYRAVLIACLALAADNIEPVDVVRIDSDQAKRVDVVSQELSKDGYEMTIVLKPKHEQFSADFSFAAAGLKRVKIVVKGAKKWDTVRYFPNVKKGKTFINLMESKGVTIEKVGNDCVIEATKPPAIHLLAPEGRLLFRMAYGSAPDFRTQAEIRGKPEEAKK